MEFSGRIASFPVSDILQWASNDRRTGALVLRRSRREKRVYFRDGKVVACISDDPAEYYGQHLLLTGNVSEGALVRALTYCREKQARLGVALRELGILSPELIQKTLRTQIEDSVCDLFTWRDGLFFFQSEIRPDEEILPQPIETMALIMEGTRWIDELQRMRGVFVHDNITLCRGKRWPGDKLSPIQQRVVAAVDNRLTLAELYHLVRGVHFRFVEATFDLAVREIVDIHSVGEPQRTASRELNLYDLLLEQAAEDQLVLSRQHLAIPIDVVEKFFPVWMNGVPPRDPAEAPVEARPFLRRIDGKTSLKDLFARDRGQLSQELEWLLRQLRAGRLALLPAPMADVEAAGERATDAGSRPWWRFGR